jgi:hypothetical protein
MASFLRSPQAADRRRAPGWRSEITLRLATPDDTAALKRLAQLESRRLTEAPHLVAERDGVVEAALCLRDGGLLADPFKRTAELCALLRCHAGPAPLAPAETAIPDPRVRTVLAPA